MTSSKLCVTVKILSRMQTSTKKPCRQTTPLLQPNSSTVKNCPLTISRDADAAIRIIRDFKDRPTVVALKHMNPCGIGQADDIETAWNYAYESDPVSIFGGIVVLKP